MSSELRKPYDELIVRLVKEKVEAGRLGLYRTMHALDKVTNVVGFEVAAMDERGMFDDVEEE